MKRKGLTARHSDELLSKMCVEYATSDLSQKEICKKYDVTLGCFTYFWKKNKEEYINVDQQKIEIHSSEAAVG